MGGQWEGRVINMWSRFVDDFEESSDKSKAVVDEVEGR